MRCIDVHSMPTYTNYKVASKTFSPFPFLFKQTNFFFFSLLFSFQTNKLFKKQKKTNFQTNKYDDVIRPQSLFLEPLVNCMGNRVREWNPESAESYGKYHLLQY